MTAIKDNNKHTGYSRSVSNSNYQRTVNVHYSDQWTFCKPH